MVDVAAAVKVGKNLERLLPAILGSEPKCGYTRSISVSQAARTGVLLTIVENGGRRKSQ
jgi:hypothetical protein